MVSGGAWRSVAVERMRGVVVLNGLESVASETIRESGVRATARLGASEQSEM